MHLVTRAIKIQIQELLNKNKVLLVLGTRRVGKTYLIKSIQEDYKEVMVVLNGEDFDVQELLRNRSVG